MTFSWITGISSVIWFWNQFHLPGFLCERRKMFSERDTFQITWSIYLQNNDVHLFPNYWFVMGKEKEVKVFSLVLIHTVLDPWFFATVLTSQFTNTSRLSPLAAAEFNDNCLPWLQLYAILRKKIMTFYKLFRPFCLLDVLWKRTAPIVNFYAARHQSNLHCLIDYVYGEDSQERLILFFCSTSRQINLKDKYWLKQGLIVLMFWFVELVSPWNPPYQLPQRLVLHLLHFHP